MTKLPSRPSRTCPPSCRASLPVPISPSRKTPATFFTSPLLSLYIPYSNSESKSKPKSNPNPNSLLSLSPKSIPMAAKKQSPPSESRFEDWLPVMAGKLGGEELIGELCNGFNLLMDREKGVINFESLKRNAAALGLRDLTDDELRAMLTEGDFDGDGALNQMEFCVLMFRLSPDLMDASRYVFQESHRR